MKNIQNNNESGSTLKDDGKNSKSSVSMYKRFVIMAVGMFIAMYFIMFSMIDGLDNLVFNINNVYMTLLMTSAMLLLELLIMNIMYTNRKINWGITAISLAVGIFSWFGIRQQINVGDKQFVKGMIPHHAAAILMSEKAKLTDPELIKLKNEIIEAQEAEIDFMKHKLKELKNN